MLNPRRDIFSGELVRRRPVTRVRWKGAFAGRPSLPDQRGPAGARLRRLPGRPSVYSVRAGEVSDAQHGRPDHPGGRCAHGPCWARLARAAPRGAGLVILHQPTAEFIRRADVVPGSSPRSSRYRRRGVESKAVDDPYAAVEVDAAMPGILPPSELCRHVCLVNDVTRTPEIVDRPPRRSRPCARNSATPTTSRPRRGCPHRSWASAAPGRTGSRGRCRRQPTAGRQRLRRPAHRRQHQHTRPLAAECPSAPSSSRVPKVGLMGRARRLALVTVRRGGHPTTPAVRHRAVPRCDGHQRRLVGPRPGPACTPSCSGHGTSTTRRPGRDHSRAARSPGLADGLSTRGVDPAAASARPGEGPTTGRHSANVALTGGFDVIERRQPSLPSTAHSCQR